MAPTPETAKAPVFVAMASASFTAPLTREICPTAGTGETFAVMVTGSLAAERLADVGASVMGACSAGLKTMLVTNHTGTKNPARGRVLLIVSVKCLMRSRGTGHRRV